MFSCIFYFLIEGKYFFFPLFCACAPSEPDRFVISLLLEVMKYELGPGTWKIRNVLLSAAAGTLPFRDLSDIASAFVQIL